MSMGLCGGCKFNDTRSTVETMIGASLQTSSAPEFLIHGKSFRSGAGGKGKKAVEVINYVGCVKILALLMLFQFRDTRIGTPVSKSG